MRCALNIIFLLIYFIIYKFIEKKQVYCAIEAVSKRIMDWACGADVSLSRTLNYHINSLQAFTSARFCEQIANS
jgi:hypothetical protein